MAAERDSSLQTTAPRVLVVGLVAGREGDGACRPAVRQRDARIGRRRDGGGDAGDDDEGDAGVDERFGLFAAAAEDEGIAALQAHHDLPLPGALDEERVELLLIEPVTPRGADDQLGRRAARGAR